MKKFTYIFLATIISCANPPGQNEYVAPAKSTMEISSIERAGDDNKYKVLLNYRITNFDPVKRKYICMYKQLVDGKMKFGTRSAECEIDVSEGETYFLWEPEKHYEKLPIIVHDKTSTTEIFKVVPPYEVSVSLFSTANSDECWKTSNHSGKKYWGCGYSPRSDWNTKTTIKDPSSSPDINI